MHPETWYYVQCFCTDVLRVKMGVGCQWVFLIFTLVCDFHGQDITSKVEVVPPHYFADNVAILAPPTNP